MIRDHDVRLFGRFARENGKARAAHRAFRSDALRFGDGDLPPRPLGNPGDEVVAVSRVGRHRPFAQAHHFLADGARAELAGGARKQRVLLRISARGFTQAHIVAPAFDKRHLGRPPVHFANGVGHSRRVEGDDLPLQRERGGGDDHAAVGFDGPFHRGGKVSDRLSGSRARLHEQMPAVVQSLGDRGRHFLLPFAPSSAHGPDDGVENLPPGHVTSFQPG